ncbi:MAG: cytochrome c oxidase assembly factor Coa1 family protein [Candidatus Acidiferrales bacterium]
METKRPGPIGVSILAIAYMCVGFGGCLLLPIFFLLLHFLSHGVATQMWRLIAADIAGDFPLLAPLMPVGPAPVLALWLLGYVLCVAIGVGLWKLRNRARRAAEAIWIVAVLVVILFAVILHLGIQIAAPLAIFSSLFPAWLIWYLERPIVRWAFRPSAQDGSQDGSIEAESSPPRGMSTAGMVWTGSVLLVTVFGYFVILMLSAVEFSFRSSDVYREALVRAGQSPCVAQRVGLPLTVGWFVSGSINETNQEGNAELSLPVHGPKGKASLDVTAERHHGVWEIKSLSFFQDDREFSLLPEVSEEGCR